MESNEQEKQERRCPDGCDCPIGYANYNPAECGKGEPVSPSKAEEKIELPLVETESDDREDNTSEFFNGYAMGERGGKRIQRDADQKEVDRLSQALKGKDKQIDSLKKVLESGCQKEDSQCIYQSENAALKSDREAVDGVLVEKIKENAALKERIKKLEGMMLIDAESYAITDGRKFGKQTYDGYLELVRTGKEKMLQQAAQSTNTEEGK